MTLTLQSILAILSAFILIVKCVCSCKRFEPEHCWFRNRFSSKYLVLVYETYWENQELVGFNLEL